jgi:hypothetical protein
MGDKRPQYAQTSRASRSHASWCSCSSGFANDCHLERRKDVRGEEEQGAREETESGSLCRSGQGGCASAASGAYVELVATR